MLKEARIVMPFSVDDDAKRIATAKTHGRIRHQLVDSFGGFTSFKGAGGWKDGNDCLIRDDVIIYDVAIEAERDASWDQLFQIAIDAGRALRQEAVYIRYPDGTVCIEPVHGREGLGALQPAREAPVRHQTEGIGDRNVVGDDERMPHIKRLPQVGDIWEARCGALVAVLSHASVLDGGYNTVSLTKGDSAVNAGRTMLHNLDGHMYGGSKGEPRPMDLKLFVKHWHRD